jgi:hypothetical protein
VPLVDGAARTVTSGFKAADDAYRHVKPVGNTISQRRNESDQAQCIAAIDSIQMLFVRSPHAGGDEP